MKDNYDFSAGIKNPYSKNLKEGYSVTVTYLPNQKTAEKPKSKRKNPPSDGNGAREQVEAL
ncbi:MAG: hypothetical protein LBR76_01425 [Oscillospiraceae bacterium]|jgi:hypothetical protein|nr:hypothetical protein [Oscillospiraceae bacterium]